jgi:hypothetical protein
MREGTMRATVIAVAIAAGLWSSVLAQFYGDGPLMEPEQQTIQELREIRRQLERPADQRQHDVRVVVAAGIGAVAVILALRYWRRRRHADGRSR